MKRLLILMLGFAALSGCGKNGGGESDESEVVPFEALPVPATNAADIAAAESADPTAYEGVYRRRCIDGAERTLSVKGLRFEVTIAIYGGLCSGQPGAVLIQTAAVSFPAGDVEGIDGAKKVDYAWKGTTFRLMNQKAVDEANSDKFLGFSDWALDETRNVSGLGDFPPYDGVAYDIIKLDAEDFLLFGDEITGDGSSEVKRPTALRSVGDAYLRQ